MWTIRILQKLCFALLVSVGVAAAQEVIQVSPDALRQHLLHRVEPSYPFNAQLARIQGVVVLKVTIDENGKVTAVKEVSGHPLLIDPARAAVKWWKFEPFMLNGKAVPASSQVAVEFWLGEGAAEQREYLQAEVECTRQIESKMAVEAGKACKKALATAAKLPPKFALDQMHAYENSARAASLLNQPDQAADDYKKELELASQMLKPGNPELVLMHEHLAHAYQTTNHLQQADAEYSEAESTQTAAQAELETQKRNINPDTFQRVNASYTRNMQIILKEHAALLRQMGKGSDAQALEQKAGSLAETSSSNQ